MYIIAKNKDYYDGVVGSVGLDKTLVYERTPTEIEDPKDMPKEFRGNRSWHHRNENPFLNIGWHEVDNEKTKKYEKVHHFLIGFCGKLYLGWKFHYNVKGYRDGIPCDILKTDIIYGYENAKKFLRDSYWRHNPEDDIKYVTNYDPIDMFRGIKAPIFVHDTDALTKFGRYGVIKSNSMFVVNPILKEYEFYKVVDAFTAFTELQMFIGGVLGVGEKEIIEVEDKYKIGQHGFDKWSFRREPSKKK